MCGGTDVIKQDGVFVCQSCGVKYSPEEAKKMMVEVTVKHSGTVEVSGAATAESIMQYAESLLDSDSKKAVEEYEKALGISPTDWRAWYGLVQGYVNNAKAHTTTGWGEIIFGIYKVGNWSNNYHQSVDPHHQWYVQCLLDSTELKKIDNAVSKAIQYAPENMKQNIEGYYAREVTDAKKQADECLQAKKNETEKVIEENANRKIPAKIIAGIVFVIALIIDIGITGNASDFILFQIVIFALLLIPVLIITGIAYWIAEKITDHFIE
jgi:tetratricopeptide (TPR) repeat protein